MAYKNQYYCVCKNLTLRRALHAAAKAKKFKEATYADNVNEAYYCEFLLNDIGNSGFGFTSEGVCESCQKLVTVEEMFDLIEKGAPPTYKLNSEYTAELGNNNEVRIGCQTFDKKTIEGFIKWYNTK